MKLLILALIFFLGLINAQAASKPIAYLSLSVGETVRNVNNSDSPLTGIYHAGIKGALPSEYWEAGILIEVGAFNQYPALGSIGEVKIRCPPFREELRIGIGGGIDFQSYFRGNYRGQFEGPQEYTYRWAPMVIGQVQFFEKAFAEYQWNFDPTIFWKFRIGYGIWG